jgi:hypothetical protein
MKHQFMIGESGYTAFPCIAGRKLPRAKRVLKDVPVQWLHKVDSSHMPTMSDLVIRCTSAHRAMVQLADAMRTLSQHFQLAAATLKLGGGLVEASITQASTPPRYEITRGFGRDQFHAYLKAYGRVDTIVHDERECVVGQIAPKTVEERLCKQLDDIESSRTAKRHLEHCMTLEYLNAKTRAPPAQAEAHATADLCHHGRDHCGEPPACTLRRPLTR